MTTKGTVYPINHKDINLQVRIDKETDNKIKTVMDRDNMSKSEVVRKGIDLQYNNENIH